jgi:hypothetical protein
MFNRTWFTRSCGGRPPGQSEEVVRGPPLLASRRSTPPGYCCCPVWLCSCSTAVANSAAFALPDLQVDCVPVRSLLFLLLPFPLNIQVRFHIAEHRHNFMTAKRRCPPSCSSHRLKPFIQQILLEIYSFLFAMRHKNLQQHRTFTHSWNSDLLLLISSLNSYHIHCGFEFTNYLQKHMCGSTKRKQTAGKLFGICTCTIRPRPV